MYKKKVTHEIVCNLHNCNHGNGNLRIADRYGFVGSPMKNFNNVGLIF